MLALERPTGPSSSGPRRFSRQLAMIDLGGDVCGKGISKLIFTILSAVAENERDRIRERIRDVKRHLAAQGVYGGGKRPGGAKFLVQVWFLPGDPYHALT